MRLRALAAARLSERARFALSQGATLREAEAELTNPDSPSRNAIVARMIYPGLTIFYGVSGVGKTFIILGTATHIAFGHPIGEIPVRRGQVIYIAAEDEWGVRMRAVAAARALGVNFDEAPFVIIPPPCLVQDPGFADAIIEISEGFTAQSGEPTVLVVVDTIGGAYGAASANDDATLSGVASSLLRIARILNCSTIAVHHVGKDPSRGMLGSIVLRNRADTVIKLERGPDRLTVRGTIDKQRNGPEGAKLTFRLQPCQIDENSSLSSLVLTDLEIAASDMPLQQAQPLGLRPLPPDPWTVLKVLVGLTETITSTTVSEWRKQTVDHWDGRSPSAIRTAWSNAIKILKQRGLIVTDGDIVSVSDLSVARQLLASVHSSGHAAKSSGAQITASSNPPEQVNNPGNLTQHLDTNAPKLRSSNPNRSEGGES
ncbi:AAA family ATPase [Microvirga arabica]|uniref:AAA family ATPase n=1 Tax=Microvirga arabica TaxID=1128671 RepID=UPI00193AC96E|nr:AAA family ATPase [Microvirga arabica]MBM1172660.1 AAA family ATPase [Microvirga arabica]